MIDLTKITTPFGLLDAETQEALKTHGGPWEYYDVGSEWEDCTDAAWIDRTTYRVKPAPPKPREYWIAEWGPDYEGRQSFTDIASMASYLDGTRKDKLRITHVREVLP